MDRLTDQVNHRVLVIDDNVAIHEDFRKIFTVEASAERSLLAAGSALFGEPEQPATRAHFELDFATQGKEGVERVREARAAARPYAVAFVDMRMPPGWDGLETIERLWAIDPNVQVVICSAHSDYDWMELTQRLGHADKLLIVKKPFEPIEIQQCAQALTCKWQNERVVERHVETLEQLVTVRTQGLEAANKQLRHLATHDALTGLPNRVLLDDRIGQAIAQAKRDGHSFAVMMVDVDRFKSVNDSLGHAAGDELLQELARRLTAVVRSVDSVVRLGGDEFVVILNPIASVEDGEHAAGRVIEALKPTMRLADVDVHVTLSVGIAFYPADASTSETLISRADAAMYCAKAGGRNHWQRFTAAMDMPTQDRIRLERDLHQAVVLGQFELQYQPKIDIVTGRVRSAEALIRWRHPERGVLPPGEFIPLAEECGLITEIGRWVLREACRQVKEWQGQGLAPVRVAVNLSASQFRDGRLLQTISDALAAVQLDPQFLEVELTETTVMSSPEDSVSILEQLSRMGVIVSVDDFGTGYSSMSYLRRFPIDVLKIDQSFISEILTRPEDVSIVKAIVSLAHSLRLKVVAEGVETVEQLEILKSLHCDQYQGFHFSTPLPAASFAGILRKRSADVLAPTEELDRTHSKLVYRGK